VVAVGVQLEQEEERKEGMFMEPNEKNTFIPTFL
jgi:hypothetical protein